MHTLNTTFMMIWYLLWLIIKIKFPPVPGNFQSPTVYILVSIVLWAFMVSVCVINLGSNSICMSPSSLYTVIDSWNSLYDCPEIVHNNKIGCINHFYDIDIT